ncbi:ImmA/IrrE family metallo-endopeptidase [Bacillus benzoevorans]|uniref:Zn-dependent peptidase ImmA (M78 family) n=1 Tax=Bacillus benzoevorans TaxID=1456 RepID=A0A7X0LVY9_9BACI|nr:ImmA/IrrE family metallo-endopeptidase [Bacillus benzoevorans]MBB6446516.1 Zn-dependent peptidase ImmA (M78 family) [Bacillus benzoevorans]
MSFISDKVKQLAHKYKTNDPFEIADRLNILVHFLPLHSEINGFYKLEKRNKFIIINQNLPHEIKRFVCAHELGHAVLHPRANTPFLRKNTLYSINRLEVEANRFAVELLLDDKIFEDYETKFDILRENGIPYEMERFL